MMDHLKLSPFVTGDNQFGGETRIEYTVKWSTSTLWIYFIARRRWPGYLTGTIVGEKDNTLRAIWQKTNFLKRGSVLCFQVSTGNVWVQEWFDFLNLSRLLGKREPQPPLLSTWSEGTFAWSFSHWIDMQHIHPILCLCSGVHPSSHPCRPSLW